MIIELHKTGVLSNTYSVLHRGSIVAHIRRSFWRDHAAILMPESRLHVRRTGILKDKFTLIDGASTKAQAIQAKPFRRDLSFEFEGQKYHLRRHHGHRKIVIEQSGHPVGSISAEGSFPVGATGDLPEHWPLVIRLFLMWIALTHRDHEEAAHVMGRRARTV